jgi:alkylation response protein AidB-like acyl-CoA dehydrogenase
MKATLTEEQIEIERTAREIATKGRQEARVCLEREWTATAAEPALLEDFSALGLPEAAGGVGTGMVEVVVALEALGRTLVPSHLIAQLAAVQVAAAAGIDVLPAVEGGERWTLAVDEPGVVGCTELEVELGADRVRGTKTMVPCAGAGGMGGGPDFAVVVVGRDAVALVRDATVTPGPSIDATRPYGDAVLDAAPTATGDLGDGLARAYVIAAADLCGAAAGAVELGVSYARDRKQFGQPIGSFQGIAFQLADAQTQVNEAWNLCLYAAWALDVADPDAARFAHHAKAAAGRAALFAAERTVQVHGGIGITMEADPHLYLRRALSGDAWLGPGRWHDHRAGALRIAATESVVA